MSGSVRSLSGKRLQPSYQERDFSPKGRGFCGESLNRDGGRTKGTRDPGTQSQVTAGNCDPPIRLRRGGNSVIRAWCAPVPRKRAIKQDREKQPPAESAGGGGAREGGQTPLSPALTPSLAKGSPLRSAPQGIQKGK